MKLQTKQYPACSLQENISEYVAHLQLHMTLQAKNLIPNLSQNSDSTSARLSDHREQMLHQTQAHFEKLVSRQGFF
ncbi:MAG: hypothetical protein HC916_06385 [Coleofasciculaceae cyanobacterium SM2_1_6]|nr:hypothetical protein [Coleofasciculaceae cyanobacterium SM2_1_6]